jgi:hypothetical protein
MTYRQIEAGLQEAIVRYLRLTLPRCVVFAVPNGGKRSLKTARLMKRTGALAGVFDLCLLAPGGKAFFIEIKAGKGQLTDSQNVFKLALIRMGFPYVVARDVGDIQAALVHWGLTSESNDASRSLFQREQSGQDGQALEK